MWLLTSHNLILLFEPSLKINICSGFRKLFCLDGFFFLPDYFLWDGIRIRDSSFMCEYNYWKEDAELVANKTDRKAKSIKPGDMSGRN